MFPFNPILVATLTFLFAAARVKCAEDPVPVQQNFNKKVGEWVLFPADVPKGVAIEEVFLRTALKKKAVAFWQPGKPLNVINAKYSGRVTFLEVARSFNISSLRVADGELYEVSVSPGEPAETVINTYRLSVFNINVTAEKLENNSCSLTLLCQAGMGPEAIVSYHWTNTASRAILAGGTKLQVIMNPTDEDVSYTCMADVKGFQSNWPIAPYEEFCRSGAAGLFKPGFLAFSSLATAVLLSMLATILTLP